MTASRIRQDAFATQAKTFAIERGKIDRRTALALTIPGVDDPDEPLRFLDAMRMTKKIGLRKVGFKWAQLNELRVEGALVRTSFHLAYSDHVDHALNARFPDLTIG